MPSSSDQVIELSVEETNALRAKLGLPPLRGVAGTQRSGGAHDEPSSTSSSTRQEPHERSAPRSDGDDDAVLEMSVDESNALRARLGLPPLRVGGGTATGNGVVVHAPAANLGDERAAKDRIERARLRRQVDAGVNERFATESLAEGPLGSSNDDNAAVTSWARQMRKNKRKNEAEMEEPGHASTNERTVGVRPPSKVTGTEGSYTSEDVKDLAVAHRASDFEEGATVTLTLQDASLLDTDVHNKVLGLAGHGDGDDGGKSAHDNDVVLENVNLADMQRHRDGLHAKRRLEMGAGRAGAYAGWDDDEFAELGGTQAPSRLARGFREPPGGRMDAESNPAKKAPGITIGALLRDADEEEADESDLFAMHKGKAISLEASRADLVASDFMTAEEDETNRKEKKSKKEPKFHKKDKKSSKKKTRKQRHPNDDDDDENEDEVANSTFLRLAKLRSKGTTKGLLEELEETALESGAAVGRKRRRDSDAEMGEEERASDAPGNVPSDGTPQKPRESSTTAIDESRAKFDAIIAKGNERTKLAFAPKQRQNHDSSVGGLDDDDEPDDAFLNAALTKARRLNRLKELAGSSSSGSGGGNAVLSVTSSTISNSASAAEAVAAAVLSSSEILAGPDVATSQGGGGGGGTVDFVVDETTEFARALQARLEQQQRDSAKRKPVAVVIHSEPKPPSSAAAISDKSQVEVMDVGDDDDDDVDMTELAKEMKPDEGEEAGASSTALDGTTGATVQLGRGLGGVLGLLQQTGELTRKNAGKEELRGRAKDERHYEDYEALDLSQVVKIDDRTATDKDREFASRQIKLEYRDEHGRLLTRKEAFRDLSKQFHGYGSGKRKTEKKLAQIAREQAEARQSQALGSLSALQKTAKATGKAYVVHKT